MDRNTERNGVVCHVPALASLSAFLWESMALEGSLWQVAVNMPLQRHAVLDAIVFR